MSLSKGIPIKYVDRNEADYCDIPWHQFVLIPKQDGSSLMDFAETMEDLRSALDNRQLSEKVPHFSGKGRELTVESVREEASAIISENETEWVDGCTGLLIIHHPDRYADLVSLLCELPASALSGGQRRLLSVEHEGRLYCLEIELEANHRVPATSLVFGLVNPAEPAVERLVDRGRQGGLRFTDLYAGKQVMERFAFHCLCVDLSQRLGIPVEEFDGKYEPLGESTYPDFEISIGTQEWAIEVARVESGMTSYVEVGRRLDQRGMNRAFGNYITDKRAREAVTEELRQKAKLRAECCTYSRHCVLLVDVVDAVWEENISVWELPYLSKFDVVAVVKLNGSVNFIKGSFSLS